ncbi:MAG: bifunctional diguanylate cyclase/phosphodiesterase [Treponema sp.]|nr:bifunctional diguanylate cyclase/phosphodiesterase [Treponema sp.]
MQTVDYKIVLDSIAAAVSICSPVFNAAGDLMDIIIESQNSRCVALTGGAFKNGTCYTAVKDMLTPAANWFATAERALKDGTVSEKTFYSYICKCHIKTSISPVQGGLLCVTLTDVSAEKEAEQQLKRQNERLAALTEELSESRAGLQKKLGSMQALNEQLRLAAYHDTMTNLNNRACLHRDLESAEAEAKRTGGKFGLILIDLDNMKSINDSNGHSAGDDVIRKFAVTLRKRESGTVTAFRFGSDEFILLMQGISGREELQDEARSLIKEQNAENRGLSCGIAVYPDDTDVLADVLKYADMAVMEAKRNGKNQACIFQQYIRDKFLQRLNIEQKLSRAMADKIFQLYYQPQFDINSGTLRGFEALLRWHDDELGWISPERFIPLAEESRLVVPIGDWVLQTALSTLATWEKDHGFDGVLSVNVSPLQFKEADFLRKMQDCVTRTGINPQHLEIEITEGILIDNFDEILKKLNFIHDMGIGISLDDFGTGYSSMRYLQMLPLTTLKIDKSFITNISEAGGKETEITESIVSLVSHLGLDAIAEGVETDEQLATLKKFNCKNINVQGFLKGRPMPRDLCDRLVSGDKSAILTIKDSVPENGNG